MKPGSKREVKSMIQGLAVLKKSSEYSNITEKDFSSYAQPVHNFIRKRQSSLNQPFRKQGVVTTGQQYFSPTPKKVKKVVKKMNKYQGYKLFFSKNKSLEQQLSPNFHTDRLKKHEKNFNILRGSQSNKMSQAGLKSSFNVPHDGRYFPEIDSVFGISKFKLGPRKKNPLFEGKMSPKSPLNHKQRLLYRLFHRGGSLAKIPDVEKAKLRNIRNSQKLTRNYSTGQFTESQPSSYGRQTSIKMINSGKKSVKMVKRKGGKKSIFLKDGKILRRKETKKGKGRHQRIDSISNNLLMIDQRLTKKRLKNIAKKKKKKMILEKFKEIEATQLKNDKEVIEFGHKIEISGKEEFVKVRGLRPRQGRKEVLVVGLNRPQSRLEVIEELKSTPGPSPRSDQLEEIKSRSSSFMAPKHLTEYDSNLLKTYGSEKTSELLAKYKEQYSKETTGIVSPNKVNLTLSSEKSKNKNKNIIKRKGTKPKVKEKPKNSQKQQQKKSKKPKKVKKKEEVEPVQMKPKNANKKLESQQGKTKSVRLPTKHSMSKINDTSLEVVGRANHLELDSKYSSAHDQLISLTELKKTVYGIYDSWDGGNDQTDEHTDLTLMLLNETGKFIA